MSNPALRRTTTNTGQSALSTQVKVRAFYKMHGLCAQRNAKLEKLAQTVAEVENSLQSAQEAHTKAADKDKSEAWKVVMVYSKALEQLRQAQAAGVCFNHSAQVFAVVWLQHVYNVGCCNLMVAVWHLAATGLDVIH